MISFTPQAGRPTSDLPRRDLVAIHPYLNRADLKDKTPFEQLRLIEGTLRQIEGTLQRLAAASRMQ